MDANNYPRLPEITADAALSVSADVLRQLINQTVIAVSNQESRPILTGVHLTITGDQLVAVATDSHRLAQRSLTLPTASASDYDIIIPGKSLTELSRMLSDDVEKSKFALRKIKCCSCLGKRPFIHAYLKATTLTQSRLIPTSSNTQAEFDAPALLASIQRASLLSHESSNNVVRLVLNIADQKRLSTVIRQMSGMLKKYLVSTNLAARIWKSRSTLTI